MIRFHPRHFFICAGSALAAMLLCVPIARAQSLDDLLNIAPPPAHPADENTGTDASANETENTDADKKPGEQKIELMRPEEVGDVFKQAVREMDDAARRLSERADAGIDTQRVQKAALDKLDQLIAQAQQQQQQQSSSSGGSGSSSQAQRQDQGSQANAQRQENAGAQNGDDAQAQQQANANGTGGGGETTPQARARGALSENRTEWGSLPPRVRDELMQGLNERYSSVYRAMTESYYQRLAEEP